MFDLGASEVLLIVVVAVIVIGPKDLPLAMRTAGKWIGKMRRMSGHFRAGFDAMVREAEIEEMEKKWKEQNAKIMAQDPATLPSEPELTGALPVPAQPKVAAQDPGAGPIPATEPVSAAPPPVAGLIGASGEGQAAIVPEEAYAAEAKGPSRGAAPAAVDAPSASIRPTASPEGD